MNHSMQNYQRAFTLLELLVVIEIIALLTTVSLISIGGTRAKELTVASDIIMDHFSLAREYAISGNSPVEVWFLRPQGGTCVEAMQLYRIDESGQPIPLGRMSKLPPEIGIDSGSTLSPLFVVANAKKWNIQTDKPVITNYGQNYDCWFVRYLPDGGTTLPVGQQWYFTLHQAAMGDQLASLPVDYMVVSISPVTGRIGFYRP